MTDIPQTVEEIKALTDEQCSLRAYEAYKAACWAYSQSPGGTLPEKLNGRQWRSMALERCVGFDLGAEHAPKTTSDYLAAKVESGCIIHCRSADAACDVADALRHLGYLGVSILGTFVNISVSRHHLLSDLYRLKLIDPDYK